jgi:hypothetical protein
MQRAKHTACSTGSMQHAARKTGSMQHAARSAQNGRDATHCTQPAPRSMQHCSTQQQRETSNRQQACNLQHTTCNRQDVENGQHATDSKQRATKQTTCSIQRQDARCNADKMQHAALQHATRKTEAMQHCDMIFQSATCNIKREHATGSMQHAKQAGMQQTALKHVIAICNVQHCNTHQCKSSLQLAAWQHGSMEAAFTIAEHVYGLRDAWDTQACTMHAPYTTQRHCATATCAA